MTFDQAQRAKKKYCCSSCWSSLEIFPMDGGAFTLKCLACGNPKGLVTKRYVEKRQSENSMEAVNARYVLSQSIPWMKSNKSEAEIIKDLGF